jgi:hypothetical protein
MISIGKYEYFEWLYLLIPGSHGQSAPSEAQYTISIAALNFMVYKKAIAFILSSLKYLSLIS